MNYRVEDLDAMLAQLREAGVEVDDEVQREEYGSFGWAVDCDGRRFELWQPPQGVKPESPNRLSFWRIDWATFWSRSEI